MSPAAGGARRTGVARVLPQGIRARLFILIALVLVPLLSVDAFWHWRHHEQQRVHALQTELEVARGVALTLRAHLEGVRHQSEALGQAILRLPAGDAQVTDLLGATAAQVPAMRNLSWVHVDGTVVASSSPRMVGADLADRWYFQQTLAGRPWCLGDLMVRGAQSPDPTVAAATAIRDRQGVLHGLVVVGLEPTRLGEFALAQQRPEGGAYALFDRQGALVFRSPENAFSWDQRVHWRATDPLLEQVLATGAEAVGMGSHEFPGGPWVSARVPVPDTGWVVGAGRPLPVIQAPLRRALRWDAVLTLGVAFLAFLLACGVARTIAGPLQRLEQDAAAMGAGTVNPREDPQAPTEVQHLRHTVQSMATALLQRAAALAEADGRKDEFLAILSHELRNPLAALRTSLHVLERTVPGSPPAQRALSVLDRQAGQLTRLVDDLLDVTRISRGKVRLQPERLELGALVARTGEDHRSLFASHGVALEVSVPDAPVPVRGDPTRLAQVVGNLLQNAAKFTPRGGHATLALEVEEHQAVIRVQDDGAGIPAETLARIFVPFVQADRTLDRSAGGLGLGLAMVKGLVEMHGGSVAASSPGAGRGATFRVCLPRDGSPPLHPAAAPAPAARGAACRRVLIIEDNVDAAESLREVLELDRHVVETASTGGEGLDKARAFRPDVILCDIGLPGMDGYAVARALRADPGMQHTRLVALSGYALPEDVAKARDAGFDRHVAKPPDLQALEQVLAESAPAPS